MPKVSVISTVLNGERFFERAVDSILGQHYDDFEWVLVDDGSTDHTAEMLGDLAARDSRVRLLTPGRLGRPKALNLATENARGEYIANHDFDDISYPSRLALQADFLDRHPEVGVLGGHYLLVDERRGERYERRPPESHEQIAQAMASRIPLAHTVVMFRKQAWRDAGGYPDVSDLEDYRLFIEMGVRGWRFASLPVMLGEHFVYEQSYWHRNFDYRTRQRSMARAQTVAIEALGLPFWTRIYPLGRHFYWLLPIGVKRAARRLLAGSRERDQPVP
jgi:glycosyltransferase involved in cell wall biosynthesis